MMIKIGAKRYVTEIFVDNMEMLSARSVAPGTTPQAGISGQTAAPVQSTHSQAGSCQT